MTWSDESPASRPDEDQRVDVRAEREVLEPRHHETGSTLATTATRGTRSVREQRDDRPVRAPNTPHADLVLRAAMKDMSEQPGHAMKMQSPARIGSGASAAGPP